MREIMREDKVEMESRGEVFGIPECIPPRGEAYQQNVEEPKSRANQKTHGQG